MSAPGHVRWRCRRGMLEMDLLLNSFLDAPDGYAALDATQQCLFENMLAESDQRLLPWILGHDTPEHPGWHALVLAIRRAAQA